MSYSRNFGYRAPASTSINLAPNTVPDTDSDGNLVASTVTNTELEYLSGVTSPIQSQLTTLTTNVSTNTTDIATLNSEMAGKLSAFSGFTSGNLIVATSSSEIGTSSFVSQAGTTLTVAGTVDTNTVTGISGAAVAVGPLIQFNSGNAGDGSGYSAMPPITRYYYITSTGSSAANTNVFTVPYPTNVTASTLMTVSGGVLLSSGVWYPINTPNGTIAQFTAIAGSGGIAIWTGLSWNTSSATCTFNIWFESS
jgi:hypothetical protein